MKRLVLLVISTIIVIQVTLSCTGLFILETVLVVSDLIFLKDAEPTNALITDIEIYVSESPKRSRIKSCFVYVEYEVDGQSYEGKTNDFSEGMDIGQEIQVYYNLKYPNRVEIGVSRAELITAGVFGILSIIGYAIFVSKLKRILLLRKLLFKGEKLCGIVTNVAQYNKFIKINGFSQYRAVCEVEDPFSGEKHSFCSKRFWSDTSEMIGLSVTIYVDPNDRSKYFIDIYNALGQCDQQNTTTIDNQ